MTLAEHNSTVGALREQEHNIGADRQHSTGILLPSSSRQSASSIHMATAAQVPPPPPLPFASFSALESLCLEVSLDVSLASIQRAGLSSCPNLKLLFLSLYGSIGDSLPLPHHHYTLPFLSHPPALSFLSLSLEGIHCDSSATLIPAIELSLLRSLPSLTLREMEFRPAPRPFSSSTSPPSPPSTDLSSPPLDILSPEAARLISLVPSLRKLTLGGVVREEPMGKLLRSRTLRDVVFLMPPDCSDAFRGFFDSVLKSRSYAE